MENQEHQNTTSFDPNCLASTFQTNSAMEDQSQQNQQYFEETGATNFHSEGVSNIEQSNMPLSGNHNAENMSNNGFLFSNNQNLVQQNEGMNSTGFQVDSTPQEPFSNATQEMMEKKMDLDDATSDTSDGELRRELDMMMASDEEEEPEKDGGLAKFKTKNEVDPKEPLLILEETLEERYKRYKVDPLQVNNLQPVGRIEFILNENIVIQSQTHAVLDLDNLLFTQNKIPLGGIDDVFGRVNIPHYSIINDKFLKQRVAAKEINVGDTVYFDAMFAKVLPPDQIEFLKRRTGCDASNQFDEEVLHGEEVEFSDDEKEQEFNRNKRSAKNENKKMSNKEKKRNMKIQDNAQRIESNVIYNQGMPFVPYQPVNSFPTHQQTYPMNPQFQAMPVNQFQYGVQGVQGQMPMAPYQNMPLFFNQAGGQNFNQQGMRPMQGYPSYPQQQQQQVFYPNNGNPGFPYQPHKNQ